MNIGALFCNSDNLPKGHYVALPVIAWDIVVEKAAIPRNYFSELIVKILSVGDKSSKELHDLTNLDEGLIHHILNYDLAKVVSKNVSDRWHLKESATSEVVEIVRSRITVLQSMVTGHLIPHPVHRNALTTLDYDINEKGRPKINGGTKGKPSTISPYIIFPENIQLPEVTASDIDTMWDEYKYNDSELATSDFDGIKSEYIEQPERIVSVTRRSVDEKFVDYLLVKVNTFAEDEGFECVDLLEPTPNISMDFLTRELKMCMESNEGTAVFLGLKEIEIPLELEDVIRSKYPNLTKDVVNEVCRLLTLKDKVDETAKDEDRIDDLLLSRFQSLYECILIRRDVIPVSDGVGLLLDDVSNKRLLPKNALENGLLRKNLSLDADTLRLLTPKSVWRDAEIDTASLKSLVLRHLLAYFYANRNNAWFITQLVNKGVFKETLKFILEMAQIRNSYQHYHANRQRLPYSYDEFFGIVEKQIEIINEVY